MSAILKHPGSALIALLLIILVSCKDDEDTEPKITIALPAVATTAVTNVTPTGATAGGNVSGNGGGVVSARGVVWGTATAPTLQSGTKTTDGAGDGSFTSSVSGLTAGTRYYLRAYATNETGTAYGEEFIFQPLEVFTELDTKLAADMTTYKIPALSIAIVRNEKLVYAKSYGLSDREANTVAGNTDRYRIASLSKPITQALILQLVQKGSITIDQKVFGEGSILGTDFGAVPIGSKKDLITVKNLLDHKSGWINSPNDPMFQNLSWSQTDIIKDLLANRALTYTPGTTSAYSNFGYLVLGRVIEKVTQKSYKEYAQSVFKEMGINDMDIAGNALKDRLPGEVKYYQSEYDPYTMNITRMDSHGGWVATSTDLARFITRVDRQTVIADLVPSTLLSQTYFGFTNWYHTGSLPGTSSILCRYNDSVSFVIIANTRTESNYDLILGALYQSMSTQIDARTSWPAYDLF